MKDITEILLIIKTLKASCREGYDGRWDCCSGEGKEGFIAMIEDLDKLKYLIKKEYKNVR